MKRRDLIRHLLRNNCELLREGSNHSIYVHRLNKTATSVPRHREIDEYLARKIFRDLKIPHP